MTLEVASWLYEILVFAGGFENYWKILVVNDLFNIIVNVVLLGQLLAQLQLIVFGKHWRALFNIVFPLTIVHNLILMYSISQTLETEGWKPIYTAAIIFVVGNMMANVGVLTSSEKPTSEKYQQVMLVKV